jgi:hypothetical protein
MKRRACFAVAILVTAAVCSAQDAIPMRKGSTWSYSGTVRWTDMPNTVRKAPVKLKSEVTEYVERGANAAALLYGFPDDLNWWNEDKPLRSWHLLVRIGPAYYLMETGSKGGVLQALKTLPPEKWKEKIAPESIFFELPLKAGNRYCAPNQRERTDGRYCWVVIGSRPMSSKSKMKALSGKPAIRLTFLTAPEETTLRLIPGVGIVSYHFAHHGTVAEADVKLTEFHLP